MCKKAAIVLICARNEERYIAETLDALSRQIHSPDQVIVVDDGSNDSTPEILSKYQEKMANLVVLRRKDRGFSAIGTTLMATTYNTALKYLENKEYDFLLILGADTIIPPSYIEDLIQEMERDPKLGILSGHDAREFYSPDFPRGPGRMIRAEIIKRMKRLPLIYSWENYIVVFAMALGYDVKCDGRFIYHLQRPTARGSKRHVYWGRVMRELGYHPLYVLGRMAKAIMRGKISMAAKLLVGYMTTTNYPEEIKPIREFYSHYQKWRLHELIFKKASLRKSW